MSLTPLMRNKICQMSKIVNFRLPTEAFVAVKAKHKGPVSRRATVLLEEFVRGEVEVTDRPPNTYVSSSVAIDDDLYGRAKEKAAESGLSIHYVIARLLEMEAGGELHKHGD